MCQRRQCMCQHRPFSWTQSKFQIQMLGFSPLVKMHVPTPAMYVPTSAIYLCMIKIHRSKFLKFSLLAKMQVPTPAMHVPTSAISLITIKIPDPNAWIQPACENACANAGNACANVGNIPTHDQNPRSKFLRFSLLVRCMCQRRQCMCQHRLWPHEAPWG